MAINVNQVVLVGRLTKDPEVRRTQSGISNLLFSVAVSRPVYKSQQQGQMGQQPQQPQADFISCVAWRQSADYLGQYAHKGDLVAVTGRIQTRNYTGQDGQKHYITEVLADRVELQSRAPAGNGAYAGQQNAYGGGYQQPQQNYGGNYQQPAQQNYGNNGYQQQPQTQPASQQTGPATIPNSGVQTNMPDPFGSNPNDLTDLYGNDPSF